MLRSHKLDEEKSFLSANYIYTEGKRLETMSFRLLDIIVAKKEEAELSEVRTAVIFDYLKEMFTEENRGLRFEISYDDSTVWAEVNLIKTVLVNLIDNACKASEEGSTVKVRGKKLDAGYRFEVEDEGIGIPVEEQPP